MPLVRDLGIVVSVQTLGLDERPRVLEDVRNRGLLLELFLDVPLDQVFRGEIEGLAGLVQDLVDVGGVGAFLKEGVFPAVVVGQ